MNKYKFIITSASPNIDEKVKAYPEILDLVDGISSVTGITRLTKEENKKQVFGKLYTDICKRLGIPFSRAIAVTDYWFDRSVENTFPINTIVTPPEISADYWIKVIDTFERKGDGNLYMGFTAKRKPPPLEVVYNVSKMINSKAMPLKAFWLGKSHLLCRWSFTELRRSPYEFRDVPVLDTNQIDSVRTYTIGSGIYLFRTTLLGDCFFIHPGKIQQKIPDFIEKSLQSIYRIIFKKY